MVLQLMFRGLVCNKSKLYFSDGAFQSPSCDQRKRPLDSSFYSLKAEKTSARPNFFGFQKIKKGVSIVEVLVVISVVLIAFTALLGMTSFSLRILNMLRETNQANAMAQETMEAVRNFRDGTSWSVNGLGTLTVEVSYYPQKTTDTPPKWQLIQGQEVVAGFTRKVVFSNASRDLITKDIEDVFNPANNDPNTKKVTVTVSWQDKIIKIITYLTNWK